MARMTGVWQRLSGSCSGAAVVLRGPVKAAGPVGLVALYGILALYMSTYFWLLSDPRIEIRRER